MVELVGLGSAMNGATLSIFFEILINYERANKIVPHIEYEHCPIEPVSLNSFFPIIKRGRGPCLSDAASQAEN